MAAEETNQLLRTRATNPRSHGVKSTPLVSNPIVGSTTGLAISKRCTADLSGADLSPPAETHAHATNSDTGRKHRPVNDALKSCPSPPWCAVLPGGDRRHCSAPRVFERGAGPPHKERATAERGASRNREEGR